jgi:membrane-associated phospholipid phosphatase
MTVSIRRTVVPHYGHPYRRRARHALVSPAVRRSTAIRAAALTVLAAGVAAPLVRRRLKLSPPVVLATAAAAPISLCVLVPRSRTRDVAVCVLQMWAYIAGYKMPNDDPELLARRVKVGYPVRADRLLGGGTTPTLRLQRALGTPGSFRAWEKLLVWSHWLWFSVPHGTVLYLLARHPERFTKGAARIYATFDVGLIGYWAVPTAPPWYAASEGLLEDGRTPELRRMMVEYGEQFWRSGWTPLYGVLGGNPLAAMPSLHFATSVMAAHVLNETGPIAGTLGWAYALLLGIALVYLGEHYVVDLAAGLALAEGVRAGAPAATPLARRLSRAVQAIEAQARA